MARSRRSDWNWPNLNQLYNIENKTLQEIADLYAVSRERVRHVMQSLNMPRTKHKTHKLHKNRYQSLGEYIQNTSCRKRDTQTLYRFVPRLHCAECGKISNLHIHHENYPIRSLKDIKILCASCHKKLHLTNS